MQQKSLPTDFFRLEAASQSVALICRKIWGGQGHSGQATKLEADQLKFVFIFDAENGLFSHFRLFFVSAEWIFFVLFFVFVPKICAGPKMLCSQLNRN